MLTTSRSRLPKTTARVHFIQRFVRKVAAAEGYQVHRRKKLSIRRRHQRQVVTGLVVNARVNLPRPVRRWLRAVEHRSRVSERAAQGFQETLGVRCVKEPTLMPTQLQGWRALRSMLERR